MITLTSLLVLSAAAPDAGITRLDLARTWEAAQLFHPSVMHREVDLDAAFVAAVKALDRAKSPEERRAAAGLILVPLKDPASRVMLASGPPEPGPITETDGGVLVLHAARLKDSAEYWGDEVAGKLLGAATRVVVDLRGIGAENPVLSFSLNPPRELTLPATQAVAHVGFAWNHPSMYHARLETQAGTSFRADPSATNRRVAVVLGEGDPIPDWALALRESGLAVFVSSDQLTDDGALSAVPIPLGDGALARVRTTEYVGGAGLVATDVLVARGKDALSVARDALLAGVKPKKKPRTAPTPPQPVRTFALGATDAAFPDREHRMLGALRLWMVARRFWAYPYLRQADPDQTLLSLLTKLETTTTLEAYRDALSEAAVALMPDSHVTVFARSLAHAREWPPFTLGWVDGKPVVSERTDNAGHVKKWDVLLELDGQKVTDLVATRLPLTPGSRLDGRRQRALELVAMLPAGRWKVTVEHADGKRETAEVTWSAADAPLLFEANRPGPHFKVLPDNIGFIDLVHLEPSEVEAAMDAVKDTRGLVFDLRGYPKGTAFEIGPRLGAKKEIPGVAHLCLPLVRAALTESHRTCEAFLQQLTVWEGRRYTAPLVALIDLQAISQSEHSCLIFEAYGQVTFVGSPTRGANGDVTRVMLPGGVGATFSGLEVKHADGRQLQTTGIEPHVLVRPTLSGLRAGKDEVLEKGLAALKAKLAPH